MRVSLRVLSLFVALAACKGGLLKPRGNDVEKSSQSEVEGSSKEDPHRQDAASQTASEADGIKLLENALANIGVDGSSAGSHIAVTYSNNEEAELEKAFFSAFWNGRYEQIEGLKQNYLDYKEKHPPSAFIESRLGYINLWKWQERYRKTVLDGSLPKSVSDCTKHFMAAFELAPKNMVMRGFGSNCRMFKALMEQNNQELYEATQTGVEAIKGLSEYAPFALSYSFLLASSDSPRFKIGTAMLQRVLDVCFARNLDRENPDIRDLQKSPEVLGRPYQYFCRNTLMAPHATEGFLFTIGDALVKANQLKAAAVMYENVRASSGFATWPFRSLVEQRLSELEANHKDFNLPLSMLERPKHLTMAVGGAVACTICHHASPEEIPLILQNFDSAVQTKGTMSGSIFLNPPAAE